MSAPLARVHERAAAFVEARGGELERRVAAVHAGAAKLAELQDWLAERQCADGGFAAGSVAHGSLSETRRVLGRLDDLHGLEGPLLERTCRFLDAAQHGDGRWEEEAADAVFETGLLAGHLAKSTVAPTAMLDAAADWLAERFAPERVQGFAWPAIAAYAATFANLPHDAADGILQWCGRELERGFRTGHFDAVRTARVLVWCDTPMLPGAQVSAAELLPAIAADQAPDGGWLAAAPPAERVRCSLDALAALARFASRC